MKNNIFPTVHDNIVERCIKPILHILSMVPNIDDLVKERKSVMLDYDFYKEKLHSMHAQLASQSKHKSVNDVAASYQVCI